jgi:hypothetical protein
MDFTNKTKDNIKPRRNLAQIYNRPTLKSHEPFCFKHKERKQAIIWLQNLKFSNGYTAGFKRVVNLKTGKLSGVKSHYYYIILERLILVMFHGYFNDYVWKALDELNYFDRQLYTKEIKKNMIEKLEKEIPTVLADATQPLLGTGSLLHMCCPIYRRSCSTARRSTTQKC